MTFSYLSIVNQSISSGVAELSSPYNINNSLSNVQEPIINAPPETRRIIERVLQTEKDKLYMKVPRNINDDIIKIIKEEVQ